jgi:hypothetical protein
MTAVSIVSALTLTNAASFAQMEPPMYSAYTSSYTSHAIQPTVVHPQVIHPSNYTLEDINKIFGYKNIPVGKTNSSQGNTSSIRTAAFHNSIYVAWLGNTSAGSTVYLSLSDDAGRSYSDPVELTSNNTGNASNPTASNLSNLCASDNMASIAWQQSNTKTGRSEIWGSISYNGGATFVTQQLSDPGADAHDPVIPAGECETVFYMLSDGSIIAWVW